MNIGVAGHVDHGKSTLVAALSGRPVDKRVEERERGITIEMNVVPLRLASGRTAGLIDVPGHEDFVHTMVAGASGIDIVLLVIAADDGIMPQTREHLLVLEQLGVRVGIPVITKIDRAPPEWLALVHDDVAQWLGGSSMAWQAPVAVNAHAGTGLESLQSAIDQAARQVTAHAADDIFRFPIDRVVAIGGAGTVATGTVWSGHVRLGETRRLMPSGELVRIRSIEQFGVPVAVAEAGSRAALGIAGVTHDRITRGMTLIDADVPWDATMRVDLTVKLAPDALHGLTERVRIRVLHGTSEVFGRARLTTPIAPGESGVVRLLLESPLLTRGGDRIVLRSWSPVATIGGGIVIDADAPKGPLTETLADVQAMDRLRLLISRRPTGTPSETLPWLLGVSAREAAAAIVRLTDVVDLDARLFADEAVAAAASRAVDAVRAWHSLQPTQPGIGLEQLRQAVGLHPGAVDAVITRLHDARRLRVHGGIAALPGFAPTILVAPEQVDRVVEYVEAAGLKIPAIDEVARDLVLSNAASVLRAAEQAGRVVAVDREHYASGAALAQFEAALRACGADGVITPARMRDSLALSRKYLMPLLEWADRAGITVRMADGRELVGAPSCQTGSGSGYADCHPDST